MDEQNKRAVPGTASAEGSEGFHSGRRIRARGAADDPSARTASREDLPGGTGEEKVLVRGGIDVYFLLIVIALVLYGAVMAFSASSVYASQKFGDSTYYFKRHLLYIVIATVVTLPFVLKARPWFWRMFALGTYALSVVLLLLVLVIGVSEGEAQRWIIIPKVNVSFQPSEIAKLSVVLLLSLYMTKYEKKITSTEKRGGDFLYGVVIPGMLLALIMGLVALEHHISGLLIIAAIGAMVMFLGGTRMRWIGLLAGCVAVAAVFLVFVSDYAQERVEIWLHIEEVDPLGGAWQTLQGLYAIGSGGLFGMGLGNSIQKYGFVSEPQNDFIFTIICEELGFVGALILVVLFVLLVYRGFKIASGAPDPFCALVVYGLTFKTALQAVLNIAVVTNSMPNTGISLPFFSSGGTSLALQIFEMGIILSISRYSKLKK